MRDITERRLNKKIKESEGQLQTIFNEAPDAIINEEGNIIRWNPKAEQIFDGHR
jgi:PAS domain S-box-containing protein